MSATYHVQIVITETTKPVSAKFDQYNRTVGEGAKERRTEELVRIGVAKGSQQAAIDSAVRMLNTIADKADGQ